MTQAGNRFGLPHLGLGLSLWAPHVAYVLEERPAVGFFEVFPENYLYTRGHTLQRLHEVAERYPITLHAMAISVGSSDPLDRDYLYQLKKLADGVKAAYVSDHLCWTGVGGQNLHTVIPFPFTEEILHHVAERVKKVQDLLGRPLFLENSPGYLAYRMSTMSEAEFLVRLCDLADCGILLDVNNLYQGAFNGDFDAQAYVDSLPTDRIGYHHVAGHTDRGTYLLDTHDHPVKAEVWELYRYCESLTGGRTTLLEWNARVPPFPEYQAEMLKARSFQHA